MELDRVTFSAATMSGRERERIILHEDRIEESEKRGKNMHST